MMKLPITTRRKIMHLTIMLMLISTLSTTLIIGGATQTQEGKPWALAFGDEEWNGVWAALVVGDYLYACGKTYISSDVQIPKPFPFIMKFNLREKKIEWCKVIKDTHSTAEDLTVKNDKIIVCGRYFLLCLNANGEEEWGYLTIDALNGLLDLGGDKILVYGYGTLMLLKSNGEIMKLLDLKAKTSEGRYAYLDFEGACYVNGRIYLVGYSYDLISENSDEDFLLACFDENLNPLWVKAFGGEGIDDLCSITSDGEYLYVCGYTSSFGFGGADAFIAKFTLDGELVWAKVIGGKRADAAYSIYLIDKYLYVTGDTEHSVYLIGPVLLIIKLDKDGNFIKAWTIGSREEGEEMSKSYYDQRSRSIILSGWTRTWTKIPKSADADCFIVSWPLEYKGKLKWERKDWESVKVKSYKLKGLKWERRVSMKTWEQIRILKKLDISIEEQKLTTTVEFVEFKLDDWEPSFVIAEQQLNIAMLLITMSIIAFLFISIYYRLRRGRRGS